MDVSEEEMQEMDGVEVMDEVSNEPVESVPEPPSLANTSTVDHDVISKDENEGAKIRAKSLLSPKRKSEFSPHKFATHRQTMAGMMAVSEVESHKTETTVSDQPTQNIADIMNMKKIWEAEHVEETEWERARREGGERGFLKEGKHYAPSSLMVFSLSNPLRLWCIYISENKYFENFILLVIFFNVIGLCLGNPLMSKEDPLYQVLQVTEIIFAIIFIFEFLMKAIGLAFVFHPDAYLRNPWNVLDFVIVVIGVFAFFPNLEGNFTGIRALRVLRPLRTFTHIQGLRIMVNSLLMSLPMLTNVLSLTLIFFSVFVILGLKLLAGALHTRCYEDPISDGLHQLPVPEGDSERVCGNDTTANMCPSGYTCIMNPEAPAILNHGIDNYDNFGVGLLTTFQCITQEGWTEIMYVYQDSVGWIAVPFFLVLVVFGAFFLLNLALAVISDNFGKYSESIDERAAEKAAEKDSSSEKYTPKKKSFLDSYIIPRVDAFSGKIEAQWTTITTFLSRPKLSQSLQDLCFKLQDSKYFTGFIVSAIVINLLVLAMEFHEFPPMSEDYEHLLSEMNFWLTIIFILEMVIKLLGLGVRKYWIDKFNRFDGFVVAVSLVELSFAGDSALSALRAFRVLRIFKLVRSWGSLRKLLDVIYSSMSALAWFLVFLFIFLIIYTVLGMQLLGGKMNFPTEDGTGTEVPRTNFDSFFGSFVTVFIVLTGENWNSIMYDAVRAEGFGMAGYLVSLVVFGNFVLFNLFLAILLENFAEEQRKEWKLKNQKKKKKKLANVVKGVGKFRLASKLLKPNSEGTELKSLGSSFLKKVKKDKDKDNDLDSLDATPVSETDSPTKSVSLMDIKKLAKGNPGDELEKSQSAGQLSVASDSTTPEKEAERPASPLSTTSDNTDNTEKKTLRTLSAMTDVRKMASASKSPLPSSTSESKVVEVMLGKSFWLFSPDNRFREFNWNIVKSTKFEWVMMFWILFSTIALAFEGPAIDDTTKEVLFVLDWIFVVIFTLEMVMKMIAMGFVLEEETYIKNRWNQLDFCIVIIAWVSALFGNSSIKSFRVLRAFRAMRPLRLLSKSGGMKAVISALMKSVPNIVNAMIVCLLFWLIFGILAVQNWGGTFYTCTDPSITLAVECVGEFYPGGTLANLTLSEESPVERQWQTPMINFDNIGNAMLTLFQLATLEGWPDVMFAAVDATKVGEAPVVRDPAENPLPVIFFFLFIIFGSFFIVNIFVGVVIDSFNQVQGEQDGSSMLTKEQAQWLSSQRDMMRLKPVKFIESPEDSEFRRMCFLIVEHAAFDTFILIAIILNAIQMATDHYPLSPGFKEFFFVANIIFTVIFIIEAVLKLLGLGIKNYFHDAWNRLDFVIVVFAIVDLAVEGDALGFVKVIRLMRIARIFKLVRRAAGVRALLKTLYFSLPSLWNVGMLMFMFFFIYSVLGVELFGKVKFNDGVDHYANFQVATGEDWQNIMNGCRLSPPDCDPDNETMGESCGNVAAVAFFVTFTIIVSFVMLNLFIAIILENFSSTNEAESQEITPNDINLFIEIWAKYDHNASNTVHMDLLIPMLREVGPPLGLAGNTSEHTRIKMARSLDIPVTEDGEVHFAHTIRALVKRSTHIGDAPLEVSEGGLAVVEELQRDLMKSLPQVNEHDFSIAEWAAAKLVQRMWRARTVQRRELRIEAMRQGIGKERVKPYIAVFQRVVPSSAPVSSPSDEEDSPNNAPNQV